MDLFRRLINRFHLEKETCASSTDYQINRIPNLSEITSILKKNSLKIQSDYGILIGSRAARYHLPNIRQTFKGKDIDWDIICSSPWLLNWLRKKNSKIRTIEMNITVSNDNELLDYYVYCILDNHSKYDFSIPRSSKSYTAYLLNNWQDWMTVRFDESWQIRIGDPIRIGKAKLLLILKKCMLYYSHQWVKMAKDYRQLLTITESLTADDKILCDLFIKYNEKVHGNRPANNDQFFINPSNTHEDRTINRDEFFQQEKDQQLTLIYHTAMSMAISDDILIGLEKICTEGPLWLADFVIDNWLAIHHQKFNQKIVLSKSLIEFSIDNYRLFPEIPELVLQRILCCISDVSDLYSMQFVCKRWYIILRQDDFWRNLYLSRYGNTSSRIDDVRSWKLMYFIKLMGNICDTEEEFQQLIDASLQVRQTKSTDVIQFWEDLTHEEQAVESNVFSKLNYILLNSLYIELKETSNEYRAKMVIFGLDDLRSRTIVDLILRTGADGNSHRTSYKEELSIELVSADNTSRSLEFSGSKLLGFYLGYFGYIHDKNNLLTQTSNTLCCQFPSGLIICLFIMLTHPAHRGQFIQYLRRLENCCARDIVSQMTNQW